MVVGTIAADLIESCAGSVDCLLRSDGLACLLHRPGAGRDGGKVLYRTSMEAGLACCARLTQC
jgi:hypothetical protein